MFTEDKEFYCRKFSFYSYKGGSGRTTTLINTAKYLTKMLNGPILIVDMDIESAGLTYFFNMQDKFSDKFKDSIHTTRVLAQADFLNADGGEMLFGDRDAEKESIKWNDVGGVELVLEVLNRGKKTYSEQDIKNIFNGIRLTCEEMNTFISIMKAWIDTLIPGRKYSGKDLAIQRNYKLDVLVERLKQSYDSGEPVGNRYEILFSEMPTCSFLDVSKYFDVQKGKVMFLGVDIQSEEPFIADSGRAYTLNKLVTLCAKHGYKAVLFDSGSGTQSSAHILHQISDVLVYCMRPTRQFIRGTDRQLSNYYGELLAIQNEKTNSDQKTVILLPTAVEVVGQVEDIVNDSFIKIEEVAKGNDNSRAKYVDSTFCNFRDCLPEVALFKWCEIVLGVKHRDSEIASLPGIEKYGEENNSDMPEDAKQAMAVYKKLAERLLYNSER